MGQLTQETGREMFGSRTREIELKTLTLEDIKPGTWLVNEAENPRYRLICTNGDAEKTFFVVSDTGHRMWTKGTAKELFEFYTDEGWKVERRRP